MNKEKTCVHCGSLPADFLKLADLIPEILELHFKDGEVPDWIKQTVNFLDSDPIAKKDYEHKCKFCAYHLAILVLLGEAKSEDRKDDFHALAEALYFLGSERSRRWLIKIVADDFKDAHKRTSEPVLLGHRILYLLANPVQSQHLNPKEKSYINWLRTEAFEEPLSIENTAYVVRRSSATIHKLLQRG